MDTLKLKSIACKVICSNRILEFVEQIKRLKVITLRTASCLSGSLDTADNT